MQSAYFPSLSRQSAARISGLAMTGQIWNVHNHHFLVDWLASISYLADGAVVEEEEGADKCAQGAGDGAGTEPPQNAAQLQHGVAAGHHHQGRVPSCQLEILHGRRWAFSKESTIIQMVCLRAKHKVCVASWVILPVKSVCSKAPSPFCSTSPCHPTSLYVLFQ